MLRADNPFTLEYGAIPNIYISRTDEAETITNMFIGEPAVSHTFLISGIRGCGKTVLMSEVASQLSKKKWVVLNLNMTSDLLEDFLQRLHEKAPASRRVTGFLKNGANISIANAVAFGVNGDTFQKDAVSQIKLLLDAFKKKKTKVIITIDEVVCNQTMKVFATQFQILRREGYDIYLIMTGLHENITAIQHDPALTFLLRAPKLYLGPLDPVLIAQRYETILQIDTKQAMRLAGITKGYAYAFQALGMLYWNKTDSESLNSLLPKLEEMLDQNAYRKIWEKLSGVEKTIVKAIPDKKIKVKDLMASIQMNNSKFSVYRSRLMEKGVLRKTERGYVDLALPRFAALVEKYVAFDEAMQDDSY